MKNLKLNVLLALALACGSAQGSMGGLVFLKGGLGLAMKRFSLISEAAKAVKDKKSFINQFGDGKDLDEDEKSRALANSVELSLGLGTLGFFNINDLFGIGGLLEVGGNFQVFDSKLPGYSALTAKEQFFGKLGIALRYESFAVSGGVRFSYKNLALDGKKFKENDADAGLLAKIGTNEVQDFSASSFVPGWFAEIMCFIPFTEQIKGFVSFELFGDCKGNEASDIIKIKNVDTANDDKVNVRVSTSFATKISVGIAYAFGSATSIGMPKDSVEERESRISLPK